LFQYRIRFFTLSLLFRRDLAPARQATAQRSIVQPAAWRQSFTPEQIFGVRDQSREVLSGVAALKTWQGNLEAQFDLPLADRTERLRGAFVTSNFFSLLGVQANIGRVFSEQDDAEGTPLVISDGLWRRDPTTIEEPRPRSRAPSTAPRTIGAATADDTNKMAARLRMTIWKSPQLLLCHHERLPRKSRTADRAGYTSASTIHLTGHRKIREWRHFDSHDHLSTGVYGCEGTGRPNLTRRGARNGYRPPEYAHCLGQRHGEWEHRRGHYAPAP
jgi:hypothetical protein